VVELKAFNKFENTSDALSAATLIIDSKPSKGLRKFLQKHCEGETLAVADSKLGNSIKEKLVSSVCQVVTFCRMTSPPYNIFIALLQKIDCLHNSAVMELMRGLRNQLTELITGLGAQDLGPMSLGLSHSLSRYKLKFSPEKVSLISVLLAILFVTLLDSGSVFYCVSICVWHELFIIFHIVLVHIYCLIALCCCYVI